MKLKFIFVVVVAVLFCFIAATTTFNIGTMDETAGQAYTVSVWVLPAADVIQDTCGGDEAFVCRYLLSPPLVLVQNPLIVGEVLTLTTARNVDVWGLPVTSAVLRCIRSEDFQASVEKQHHTSTMKSLGRYPLIG